MPAREHLDVPYGEIDPDEHPDWRAARECGIDVYLLEARLRLTPHERVMRQGAMHRLRMELHGRARAPGTP
ncbi:MAG: hypothetical protein IAG13_32755 [Deltaproteobacteria bacterium]|nr:hypothetical protein [Nannocystaceae bacterium]